MFINMNKYSFIIEIQIKFTIYRVRNAYIDFKLIYSTMQMSFKLYSVFKN